MIATWRDENTKSWMLIINNITFTPADCLNICKDSLRHLGWIEIWEAVREQDQKSSIKFCYLFNGCILHEKICISIDFPNLAFTVIRNQQNHKIFTKKLTFFLHRKIPTKVSFESWHRFIHFIQDRCKVFVDGWPV